MQKEQDRELIDTISILIETDVSDAISEHQT